MPIKSRLDNLDIIPFAFFQLGGTGDFVDVEDAFLKCFELTPERFRWRKHNIPNYKTLSKALRDFENKHPGFLLKTEDGLSRQLSSAALEWLRHRQALYDKILKTPGANPPTRRADQRLLNEIRDHPLVKRYSKGKRPVLRKPEVADLLLCSPDSPTSVWAARLETHRSIAASSGRPDLIEFLDYLVAQKPEWFGRG